MGQLLVPAMIGAGLGAGGAGLMGAGAAGGAGAATAAGGADLAAGTVAPAILGTPTLNASLLTPGAMAGLGATPSVYGGLGASSLLDKTGAFLTNNIGNPFTNMSTMDKINLGAKGFDALNQPQQQQMQAPPVQPITRGNPEMVSSPLFNVGPNVGMQQGNDVGMPNLMTRMPLTEEELLRLQQQMQTTGFRGR